MKTVFRKGMKVYDSVSFPDSEGKVVDVEERIDCVRVIVQFDCLDYEIPYTEQGIRASTRKESTPTLSTKPYTLQGFEQKAPAPTFEEVLVNCDKKYPPNIRADVDYKEIYPTKELSEAAEALRRLLFLRDYYNDGWQPDWEDGEEKFSIQVCEGEFHTFESIECQRVFSFKTEEIRDKFLEEQRELLEIAKPLL